MYSKSKVKFIDDEESAIKKVKLTQEMIAKIPKIDNKPLAENSANKENKNNTKSAANSI